MLGFDKLILKTWADLLSENMFELLYKLLPKMKLYKYTEKCFCKLNQCK